MGEAHKFGKGSPIETLRRAAHSISQRAIEKVTTIIDNHQLQFIWGGKQSKTLGMSFSLHLLSMALIGIKH